MTEEPDRLWQAEERLDEPNHPDEPGRSPGGLTWPIRRFYWALEKHLLWPIADSFKRFTKSLRYRSPIAYIGATMLLTLTVAAFGAAFYFYNQAEDSDTAPVVADVPAQTEAVVAPTTPAPVTPVTPPSDAKPDDTLKGVVPDFDNASGDSKGSAKSGGNGSAPSALNPAATVVKPSETPDSPPLKVAHNFAQTFVDYEVGKKGAAADFEKTATPKLSKELKKDPPRQPSNGDIPKASVMNVVKGDQNGETLDVSVSLLRSGTTSELRLALERQKGKKWLVSEVRG